MNKTVEEQLEKALATNNYNAHTHLVEDARREMIRAEKRYEMAISDLAEAERRLKAAEAVLSSRR